MSHFLGFLLQFNNYQSCEIHKIYLFYQGICTWGFSAEIRMNFFFGQLKSEWNWHVVLLACSLLLQSSWFRWIFWRVKWCSCNKTVSTVPIATSSDQFRLKILCISYWKMSFYFPDLACMLIQRKLNFVLAYFTCHLGCIFPDSCNKLHQ